MNKEFRKYWKENHNILIWVINIFYCLSFIVLVSGCISFIWFDFEFSYNIIKTSAAIFIPTGLLHVISEKAAKGDFNELED